MFFLALLCRPFLITRAKRAGSELEGVRVNKAPTIQCVRVQVVGGAQLPRLQALQEVLGEHVAIVAPHLIEVPELGLAALGSVR